MFPILTKKCKSVTVEGSSDACFADMISPAILNARSEEAAVASNARYFLARRQILGYFTYFHLPP